MIISQEGWPANFDIVKPLLKSKGTETEDLILFFGWLGVLYLLAGRCQWHGAKFCIGQLKFHLMCVWWKNMSESYWTNLCASPEDWLVWWMCTRSRRLLHKEETEKSKPPESCCHSKYRYLHQRLLSIVSWFSESRHVFLARSKMNHILDSLGPPGNKCVGWTKNLPKNIILWAPTQPESGEWLRESGGTGILKPRARDRRYSWMWWIMYGEANNSKRILPLW